MTEKAVRTFLSMEPELDFKIILINNGSREKLDDKKFIELGAKLIKNKTNLGFAKAVNQGIALARGEYVLLLNSDVLIEKNSISKMIDYIRNNSKVAVVGPRLIYPNGNFQSSFGRFPNLSREFMRWSMLSKILPGGTLTYKNLFTKKLFKELHQVDWISGACMLISYKAIKEIGKFDENYFFGIEDYDFCYRAKKAGWQVVHCPESRVTHYHGFSSGGRRSTISFKLEDNGMEYFFKKHFPKKIISRYLIKIMYRLKILILNLIFKLKNIYEGAIS